MTKKSSLLSAGLTQNPLNFFAHKCHRIGEKLGISFLTYNPLLFWHFHRLAKHDAQLVATALTTLFDGIHDVADVGCGSGAYAAAIQNKGLNVEACEYSWIGRAFTRHQGITCHPFDLSKTQALIFSRSFDLAYCYEVAEHIPPELGLQLAKTLIMLAPIVVFTAAHPGQGGHGHVNEQPKEYWIRQFNNVGATYDDYLTSQLKQALSSPKIVSWWLSHNCLVFRRCD